MTYSFSLTTSINNTTSLLVGPLVVQLVVRAHDVVDNHMNHVDVYSNHI